MNFVESTTIRSGMIELVRDTMTLGIFQRVLFWSDSGLKSVHHEDVFLSTPLQNHSNMTHVAVPFIRRSVLYPESRSNHPRKIAMQSHG